jgi:hypothetical protein
VTTTIARIGVGLTVADVLMLEMPHLDAETREYVLWEFTGWPEFWPRDEHPVHALRRQLRDFTTAHHRGRGA